MTFNAGGATIDTNGNTVTLANSIGNSGTGGFTKAGAGTLTLSSAVSYTGGTTVTGGTLVLGGSEFLPDTAPLTVNGGTLDLQTNSETVGSVTLDGAGAINST